MKTLRKVQAVFMMIVMVALPLLSNPVKVHADGETYTIKGYYNNSGKGVITDAAGNVVSERSFCLDSKEDPPSSSGTSYTRIKLSEMTASTYTKDHAYLAGKGYSDEVKIRLLKIMMEGDALIEYAQTIDPTEARDWIIENRMTTKTEEQMKSGWNSLVEDPLQNLIWVAVHEEREWPNYVMDSVYNTGGKADNYYVREKNYYGYFSTDPMNDRYSLWSVFYQPMMDYIDNNIKDYTRDGYDAWVYLGDPSHQNMLGTVFRGTQEIEIAKIDGETALSLENAELEIEYIDDGANLNDVTAVSNGVSVELEHTSETEISFVTGQYSVLLQDMPVGDYVLRESSVPAGHVKAEDVEFTIHADGSVTSTASNAMALGKITMIDHVVRLLKVDAEDGTPISDAMFVIIRSIM